MKTVFDYLVFPGLLFAACTGLLAGWVDRKLTARLQWRIGPPWYQNFLDIIKLFYKENIVPHGGSFVFLLAPYLGLVSLAMVATVLGKGILNPLESYAGDLIVVLYLSAVPAIALIIGASSSRNPLASVGASREMKLVLGYELPFILSIVAVIIKTGGSLQIGQIVNHQINFGSNIFSFSGVLAFLAAFVCMQAKTGFAPFDISEAEQEIMAGVLIEYSGVSLAVFKLSKALMLYCMPVLVAVLFLGKDVGPLFITVKVLSLLFVMIIVKNTNPRLRIDQALRFLWGPVSVCALCAVILALAGF